MGRATISAATLFGSLSWLVLLAGLASTQAGCRKYNYDGVAGTAGYFSPGSCTRIFALSWWICWYQFFVLVGIVAAMATSILRWRPLLLGVLGPLTALMMQTADTFLFFQDAPVGNHARPSTAAAGAIMLSIANFLLIASLSLLDEAEIPGPPPVPPKLEHGPDRLGDP